MKRIKKKNKGVGGGLRSPWEQEWEEMGEMAGKSPD
jgi:hypothetical protein